MIANATALPPSELKIFRERESSDLGVKNTTSEPVDFIKNVGNAHFEAPQDCRHFFIRKLQSNFIESYKNGNVCVALRRMEEFSGCHPTQDGFVFGALDRSGPADPHHAIGYHQMPAYVRCGTYQPLMLAQNVQTVKGPEGVIPSIIWFERFDRGNLALGKPLFAFDACQRIDKVVEASKNWEMRISARICAVACGQGSCDQIKAATQRIDDRSHPSIECERERLIVDYRRIATTIKVWLFGDVIGISADPFDKALLEQWDLGIGPI